MSMIKSKTLSFAPSDSPDVVGYKLYIEEAPNPVSYSSQAFDLGNNTEVDLISLPGMADIDSVYNMGVAAVDDAGNESEMSLINDVPLDFVAPNPPGMLSLA